MTQHPPRSFIFALIFLFFYSLLSWSFLHLHVARSIEPKVSRRPIHQKNSFLSAHALDKIANDKPKKIIRIQPGAYAGMYQLGVAHHIKTHFRLNDEYIYYGSSSGSWISLLMAMKPEIYLNKSHIIIPQIIAIFQNAPLSELVHETKKYILDNFRDQDFHIDQVAIEVTEFVLPMFSFKRLILANFRSLEDVLDACIASSHIPFITNNVLIYKYRKTIISFDGGLMSVVEFMLRVPASPSYHIPIPISNQTDIRDINASSSAVAHKHAVITTSENVVIEIHKNMWATTLHLQDPRQRNNTTPVDKNKYITTIKTIIENVFWFWYAVVDSTDNILKFNKNFQAIFEKGFNDSRANDHVLRMKM